MWPQSAIVKIKLWPLALCQKMVVGRIYPLVLVPYFMLINVQVNPLPSPLGHSMCLRHQTTKQVIFISYGFPLYFSKALKFFVLHNLLWLCQCYIFQKYLENLHKLQTTVACMSHMSWSSGARTKLNIQTRPPTQKRKELCLI